MVEFGEVVLAKMKARTKEKGKAKNKKKKLTARAVEAVWVGIVPGTGEHIVVKASGDAVRCRRSRESQRASDGMLKRL